MSDAALATWWAQTVRALPGLDLPAEPPAAWAFGAGPAMADELLALVLAGTKTATASADEDFTPEDPRPHVGDFSVLLDGAGAPRALIRTTQLQVVPFDQVTAEHAHAEGEGVRSLESWRRIHERFWREHSAHGYRPDMPVLCERFEVLHR